MHYFYFPVDMLDITYFPSYLAVSENQKYLLQAENSELMFR